MTAALGPGRGDRNRSREESARAPWGSPLPRACSEIERRPGWPLRCGRSPSRAGRRLCAFRIFLPLSRTPRQNAANGARSGLPESIACWKAARAPLHPAAPGTGALDLPPQLGSLKVARVDRQLVGAARALDITLSASRNPRLTAALRPRLGGRILSRAGRRPASLRIARSASSFPRMNAAQVAASGCRIRSRAGRRPGTLGIALLREQVPRLNAALGPARMAGVDRALEGARAPCAFPCSASSSRRMNAALGAAPRGRSRSRAGRRRAHPAIALRREQQPETDLRLGAASARPESITRW